MSLFEYKDHKNGSVSLKPIYNTISMNVTDELYPYKMVFKNAKGLWEFDKIKLESFLASQLYKFGVATVDEFFGRYDKKNTVIWAEVYESLWGWDYCISIRFWWGKDKPENVTWPTDAPRESNTKWIQLRKGPVKNNAQSFWNYVTNSLS